MNDQQGLAPTVEMIEPLDVTGFPWCADAAVVGVTLGRGTLRTATQNLPDDLYGRRTAVMLNGVPLVRSEGPYCPTCESMLATGYGMNQAGSGAFRAVADQINAPYTGFADAIERIAPILGLLGDGIYAVVEANLYPCDGNGHFFWNVPNAFTYQPATGSPYISEGDVTGMVGGMPAYLYPSQPSSAFDQSRVGYYTSLLTNPAQFPRAIAYSAGSLMAVLLDGHHKATACALTRRTVPTLVILPWTDVLYPADSYQDGRIRPGARPVKIMFGGTFGPTINATALTEAQIASLKRQLADGGERELIAVDETRLADRAWPVAYANSWRAFPSVYDFAVTMVAASHPFDIGLVDDWLAEPERQTGNLGVALRLLAGTDPQRARDVALRVARLRIDPQLTLTAFQVLDAFHDDEVDQVFIDEVVTNDDRRNALREVADHHWDSLADSRVGGRIVT